jgi:hypothetical protein
VIVLSGTVSVPPFAVQVVITGAFGASYQVPDPSATWLTGFRITGKLASQFTVTFDIPSPGAGGSVDWVVITEAPTPGQGQGCTLAGVLVTQLRAKIPDGVFMNNLPQPEMDGKFRAQTLYGWLNDAMHELTQKAGWTVADWWAMPQIEKQPWYDVDERWTSMEHAFSNQWPVDVISLDEAATIWPNSQGPISQQPLFAYVRKLGCGLQTGLFPTPMATDPATTLSAAINATGADPIAVTSTFNFLSFGYVRIEDEILAYQELLTSPARIGVITRGVGGTLPVAHAVNAPVQHLGFWMKGRRTPNQIVNSLSPVEIPRGWISHLETYVLGQARCAQKGRQAEGERLLQAFDAACRAVDADPNWKDNKGQIPAFGDNFIGGLYWPRSGGVIVR